MGKVGVTLQQGDLEGSLDATRVASLDRTGQPRGESHQALERPLEPVGGEIRADSCPDRGIRRQSCGIQSAHDRAEVEAGPAGEQRDAATGTERREDRADVGVEGGDREDLVGIDQVQAVMDDSSAVPRGRLGRSDVQSAVDLARIGGDDLGHVAV